MKTTLPPAPFRCFDIECRPRLDLVERFAEPYPDFDPAAVKYGNTKDPIKRSALLESKRAEHEEDALNSIARKRERAALDPLTGEIIVIGVIDEAFAIHYIEHANEKEILVRFWAELAKEGDAAIRWLFWSGSGDVSNWFDLDYIVTRSRLNGVRIPSFVRDGRYYSKRILCLAKEFLLYKREKFLSLTRAGEVFDLYRDDVRPRVGRKSDQDPVTGENFHQWWDGKASEEQSAETQRDFAKSYLDNDLMHVAHLAKRIL